MSQYVYRICYSFIRNKLHANAFVIFIDFSCGWAVAFFFVLLSFLLRLNFRQRERKAQMLHHQFGLLCSFSFHCFAAHCFCGEIWCLVCRFFFFPFCFGYLFRWRIETVFNVFAIRLWVFHPVLSPMLGVAAVHHAQAHGDGLCLSTATQRNTNYSP